MGGVIEAKIGSNMSYIWRSLCWSRMLLDPGLRWRIANGSSIQLFQDVWIPRLNSSRVMSRIAFGSMVFKFITDTNAWDEDLINMDFLPHEGSAIINTLICVRDSSDARYWSTRKKAIIQ